MGKKAFAMGLMAEPASFYYGVMRSKLYKAEFIHKHGILCNEEPDWSEDFLLNLEYIRHARRFVALHTPVYYYAYNPCSLLHSKLNLVDVVKNKRTLFSYYKELYQELGLYDDHAARIHRYLIPTSEHI